MEESETEMFEKFNSSINLTIMPSGRIKYKIRWQTFNFWGYLLCSGYLGPSFGTYLDCNIHEFIKIINIIKKSQKM